MRHNGRPVLKASKIRPSDITLYLGEPVTVVCGDCRTWRQLTRSMIPAHRSTDLGRSLRDDEGNLIKRDTRCPGSGQRIEVDLKPAQWAARIEDGLTEVASRRPTKVLRKVKAPQPAAVLQIAQPRPAAPAPTGAERTQQWADVLRSVKEADTQRSKPLKGARGPIFGLTLPEETPAKRHKLPSGRVV
ncbi:hypothetical protein [Kitasatospora sp. NBC_01302]|uniref:hypothetical protein n=1 Tax=Kitasatospora sp. NBC_01302 TaxID=2903575 RepID=UPI002E15CA52|nr:hypothetical protein OG294_39965 [Kitasatospora sp. NBC_01302]